MKQILITVFCFGLYCLFFACASKQENAVAASPEQNAPLAQSTVETPTGEPTPAPLSEKVLKRRAEVHELMLKGEFLHDGSMELERIGDISSVPALLVVLKKNPPMPGGRIICTAAHALQALHKITGANPGVRHEDWSAWWEKYQEEQKAKDKSLSGNKAT